MLLHKSTFYFKLQKTGPVLLFLATLSILKISDGLKIQPPRLNVGFFFFRSSLDTDCKWSMLYPLRTTKCPRRGCQHGSASLWEDHCEKIPHRQWHFPEVSLARHKTESTEKVPFHLRWISSGLLNIIDQTTQFYQWHQVRNQDKRQAGPPASQNRWKGSFFVFTPGTCAHVPILFLATSGVLLCLGSRGPKQSWGEHSSKGHTRAQVYLLWKEFLNICRVEVIFTYTNRCPCFEETHTEEFRCKGPMYLQVTFKTRNFM